MASSAASMQSCCKGTSLTNLYLYSSIMRWCNFESAPFKIHIYTEMQLQMNSSFKKVLMLIPLWEQRPSGLTRLPPLAASLPSGWSAAASAQPVPAFPEVAGFSLQSMTNKSNPNSHEQIRLRLFCPFIPVSKLAFRSTRSREYQKTHFSREKERRKGDGVKGCTRVGRAGSEWQNNQNDT